MSESIVVDTLIDLLGVSNILNNFPGIVREVVCSDTTVNVYFNAEATADDYSKVKEAFEKSSYKDNVVIHENTEQ